MLLLGCNPGEQVTVIPDWVFKTLAKKGQVEDLFNFSKMRQWFSQDQLVAMDVFSGHGFELFWNNGNFTTTHNSSLVRGTKTLGYSWFFPEDQGVSNNGNDADRYAKNQISQLTDNKEYSLKLVHDYVIDGLKDEAAGKKDANQSYSVYSPSNKMILIVLNQGCLTVSGLSQKESMRLSILREVLKKMYQYYDLNVVHKSMWFEWYLTELDCLK